MQLKLRQKKIVDVKHSYNLTYLSQYKVMNMKT